MRRNATLEFIKQQKPRDSEGRARDALVRDIVLCETARSERLGEMTGLLKCEAQSLPRNGIHGTARISDQRDISSNHAASSAERRDRPGLG